MCATLAAYEERTSDGLRAMAARLAALPPAASIVEVLRALGLAGNLRDDLPARVPRRSPPTLGVPGSIEAWGFAAGQRQLAFVTVAPERVDATIAQFPGAHVEVRERRVEIGAQDRWRDDRTAGAPRVELYVAKDAATARHAAELQAADPTRHAAELGGLLGYPPCCVEAFGAQRTRNDNSLNRYLAAARTDGAAPWPWLLNDLHLRLVAFYPCRYTCPAAVAVARATVDAIDASHPGAAARLAATLTTAVFYVDHDHQLWLGDPSADGDRVRYRAITAIGDGRGVAALATLAAAGDELALGPNGVEFRAGDREIASLARLTDARGVLMRFA